MSNKQIKPHGNTVAALSRIDSALQEQSQPNIMGLMLGRLNSHGSGPLALIKLNAEQQSLKNMDRLYRHGFGSDFPFPIEMHRRIVERGVVIGAIDEAGELVGMWGMFLDYKDGHPVDPPVIPGHEQAAYLSHCVVHEKYRGSGVGLAIARVCAGLVERSLIAGIRASVSPWNYPSLGLFFKAGFSIVDFCKNLYGPGKHRFHVLLSEANKNTACENKNVVVNKLQKHAIMNPDGDLEKEKGGYIVIPLDSAKRSPVSLLEDAINSQGYKGVLLLKAGEMKRFNPMPHSTDAFLLCSK